MPTNLEEIHTLEDLREYIHRVLCEKENLLADQFTMTEAQLTQAGRDCGLQFTLAGPRNVRLGAIWSSIQNTVYYYDTRGNRYRTEKLLRPIAT